MSLQSLFQGKLRMAGEIEAGREHLELAKKQLEKAQIHSWEPAEPAECISKVFYAYENAVVALAEAKGVKWEKHHGRKADLAKAFADEGILKSDISEKLRELNELRKDVAYGEPGFELAETDLEEEVSNLETFIDDVERLIDDIEAELHHDG